MQKRPNLIIAGVHKAATTSLYTYLTAHSDIYGSGKKEIHYFTPIRFGMQPENIADYEKYFTRLKNEKYAVDASPSYFYGEIKIIEQMRALLPPHKVIVVLRDPVDRFISNFNFLKSKLLIKQDEDLNSFINNCIIQLEKPLVDNDYSRALMEGKYIDFLPAWIDNYGNDFKIIYFEDLISNPAEIMVELAQWLDIDVAEFETMQYTVENKTIFVKNRTLHSFALFINHSMEVFLRKNHSTKVFFRKIYYLLNQKKHLSANLNNAGDEYLKNIYKDSNTQLRNYLLNKNLKLPRWL